MAEATIRALAQSLNLIVLDPNNKKDSERLAKALERIACCAPTPEDIQEALKEEWCNNA